MLLLIQRVKRAHVEVDAQTIGAIQAGLLVFLCAEPSDTTETVQKSLQKVLNLRIFSDENGKMNLNVQQVNGGLLIVSQFTLAADTQRGHRPSFTKSAAPVLAQALYEQFITSAQAQHPIVASGQFAANMDVCLINDGPITIPMQIG